MKTFDELQQIIDREIRQIDKDLLPKELYEPIWYTLSNGGKRLRPALVLMGCQLFTEDIDQAVKPALGIEMFHNFTLLHDDIMDKAFLRRSHPTVHIKWNINRAILSGDALAIKSNIYLSSCNQEILPKVLKVFNQTALQVCEGQQYDLNFELRESVSEVDYLNMIKLKTAVLLAGSLQIGAMIGGADDAAAVQLYHYGYHMGMAFQLQDDYLDTFGDPEVFGKSIGGDILTNKKTFLLIKALELANPEQFELLNKWYSTKDTEPEDKINAVTNIFKQFQIDRLTREKVEVYSNDALKILTGIPVPHERKTELEIFTRGLIHRVK